MSLATWIETQDVQLAAQLLGRPTWSVEEYLQLPEAATRIELVDGSLVMSPAPASGHQRIARRLTNLLEDAIPDGWDAVADANLRLGPSTVLRPDVMVVTRSDDVTTFEPAEVMLVVEIVSPGSTRLDRVWKPEMYAAAGIGWYLLVERRRRGTPSLEVIVHRLKDGDYVEHSRVHAGQVLRLTEPFEVSFDPAILQRRRV